MSLTKQEREELSSLSKEVFGTRSQWQKMIKKGSPELVTRTVVKEVAGEDGQVTPQESKEAVLTHYGARQFTTKYYTVESIKEYMLTLKAQRDELIAMINKQNEERKEKEEREKQVKQVQEESGGSAL